MQLPTSRSWDRRLNLVGVLEIARTRQHAESRHDSRAPGLPSAQEILDAVLGTASTSAAREQQTLALWAGELAHICLQAPGDFAADARMRAARIIRIIDIWIEIHVLPDDDVQDMRGETLGSLIDRIAEVGAELYRAKDVRTTAETSATILEHKLDRLSKEYTTLATELVAGR